MDKNLLQPKENDDAVPYVYFDEGFRTAIALLRANKYHGHYAKQCADWLEAHLTKEVSSKTTTTYRGY